MILAPTKFAPNARPCSSAYPQPSCAHADGPYKQQQLSVAWVPESVLNPRRGIVERSTATGVRATVIVRVRVRKPTMTRWRSANRTVFVPRPHHRKTDHRVTTIEFFNMILNAKVSVCPHNNNIAHAYAHL